ncbi:PilZ domain-containing protein [Corallococcus carmarthensis]|uniref:PilZ domain-containing protein n=1 Tax=Corallococcus carmarthensis TaxID=2316728 RepID=A0A3A8JU70_9BACT|nr:PilZ domain-containing protein [Corallococcus carmarthensis]NOK21166.1 PilZ domain-containing protein [Corallococcus carmarthensis]RKG98516.1 PilZ domain-containing protein [Corallococcus carmarthensis]
MSVPTHEVLIVHPNEMRRNALKSALGAHRVSVVGSQLEAARRMEASVPTLIIAPADNARRFLRHVDRAAPEAVCVFVCARSDQHGLEELVETAAEGHVFSTVDDALTEGELSVRLRDILQLRASTRVSLDAGMRVDFVLRGQPFTAECQDLGHFGAALQVPMDASMAAFLPGTPLDSLTMVRDGRPVLHVDRAYVRHATPIQQGTHAFLRVGISWRPAHPEATSAPPRTLRDAVAVQAALRKALRRELPVWLHSPDSQAAHFRLESATVEPCDERGLLRGRVSPGLPASVGEVVHLSFEMGGQRYRGVTSMLHVGHDGVSLGMPRSLAVENRRGQQRFRPSAHHRFLVHFTSPFSGQRITRAVLDLGARGFAFPIDASCEVLPVGSHLDTTLLLPDGSEVACRVEVRSVEVVPFESRHDQRLRPYRCGVRILDMPRTVRDAIIDAFVSARAPQVRDGAVFRFPDLWRMMEDARYTFHPDHPFGEESRVLPVLEATHERLSRARELGRSLVFTDTHRLLGHVNGLRMYSGTWLVQHLAVMPGFRRSEQISSELTSLAVEVGEAMEDVEFIRYMWRTDNRWPHRLGTWLARVLEGQGLCHLRQFHYLRADLDLEPAMDVAALPAVREAGPEDRRWLESYLRRRGEMVRLLSEDLRADPGAEASLSERFRTAGLHRERRMFVVEGEAGPLALALQDEATPGLSLIEVTNGFNLVVADREDPRAKDAVAALVLRCMTHARERGRHAALGMVDVLDVPVLRELGFVDQGRFSEWTFHRSMVRRWCEAWRSLFERQMPMRRMKQRAPSSVTAAAQNQEAL